MDERLPVEACLDGLRVALAGPGHAVLQAPPGAGKTTIVPLRLLDEPWLDGRRIVMLEPRRLATRAAARRMAVLVGDEVGGLIGYRTRDERRTSGRTRVEVVTEGILTRRLQHDPALDGVGLVIFDEFHERNLQGDLGLALALDARRVLRPDLRLLVMSATLDGERVAKLLGGDGPAAPIVTSEGRTFPIDVRWSPPPPKARIADAMTDAVRRALREEPGDVLAFLPGAGEIRRVESALAEGGLPPSTDVRPLYGALASADQDAAIAPSAPGRRKVVLSTDIAETSLTVEGVRVVVDGGLARVPRFDARTGLTRLVTVPASRASADQRAGRAGRTEPGAAYRLWSKVEHAARRPFIDPEITQVDLAGLALELAGWGVDDPAALPFLDAPPARALAEARELLRELAAVDGDGRLTEIGRRMADLPLHPRLAHMVAATADGRLGWLACLLGALLEDRDVLRGRPDDLPVDVAIRLLLLDDPSVRHPLADGRAVRGARQRAAEIARRAGIAEGPVELTSAGVVAAFAYPDRVAQARDGGRGRFRLRGGSGAWLPVSEPLASERFLVAVELDGKRGDARVRLAAPIDEDDVLMLFAGDVEETTTVAWDKDRSDLVERVERRLGGLRLSTVERRPEPGPSTERALVERVRATRLAALRWTDEARSLQQRSAFVRAHGHDDWPDLADAALVRELDDWLPPYLPGATGRADLEAVDVEAVLRGRLGRQRTGDLDRLAPRTFELPNGRRVRIAYGEDPPVLAVRVQQVFGLREHPAVAGGAVPLVLHLLSPADRPIQITSDLPGFWTGSWQDVRKDLAGRYPKHAWPADPTARDDR